MCRQRYQSQRCDDWDKEFAHFFSNGFGASIYQYCAWREAVTGRPVST